MEKSSSSRPYNDGYGKLALDDPELDSDEGTVTPTVFTNRYKRRTFCSSLWLCARVVFITAAIVAWAASMWLTHLASRELVRARALISQPRENHCPTHADKDPLNNHEIITTGFIPGATLPVPGYGMVYNTSYCNGWKDPEGAKARGCVLDPSQGGWVHQLCHDPELLEEWLSLPDFGWYLDSKRKQHVPQEKIWAADIPGGVETTLYTAQDFHVQHCKFVMRLRVKNGMRKNRGLGYLPLDPSHMYHCIHLMTELNTLEAKSTELTQVILGKFGGGTEGFGLAGECYMPVV
jgi:hypothetical protein